MNKIKRERWSLFGGKKGYAIILHRFKILRELIDKIERDLKIEKKEEFLR